MKNMQRSLLWPVDKCPVHGRCLDVMGIQFNPSLFIRRTQVLRSDSSEAAPPLGSSLSSPSQGKVPTGRAVKLGEIQGQRENVCFAEAGPSATTFLLQFLLSFISAPSGYFARNEGLWAGPSGNSCVHLPDLVLLRPSLWGY